jgi:probable F420-dependent oxidoreductase
MSALVGLGRVGVWGHLDSLDSAALPRFAERVAQLGYAALWVPETVGREPFVALASISRIATESGLSLGTGIASIYARDAVTARTAAMALHEMTGGRFILGLGVSHPHLVTRLRGHEYERPVPAMRAYLEAYRAAPYHGPRLDDTSEPPVVVAALRAGMTRFAGREADGAFPYLVTPSRLLTMRRLLDEVAAVKAAAVEAAAVPGPRPTLAVTLPVVLDTDLERARAAARTYLAPYLRTPNYRANWLEQDFGDADWEAPGSDRLVDAMVAHGDEAAVERRLREMLDAGADHVALIALSADGSNEENLAALEALAAVNGAE